MKKLLTAAMAAATLLGVGAISAPADAAGQYSGYRHDGYRRDCDWRHPTRYGCPAERQYDRRHHGRRYDRSYRGYRSSAWQRHVYRCEHAYRSYNPRTDTYWTRWGGQRRCRL